jgi:hypothetical protein
MLKLINTKHKENKNLLAVKKLAIKYKIKFKKITILKIFS